MATEPECCGTCRFAKGLPLTCRRKAPVALMVGVDQMRGPVFTGAHAPVERNHWCGEYEAAPPLLQIQ